MKKTLLYWILVILTNYGLTIGIGFLFRAQWDANTFDNTGITGLETFFIIAVLPNTLLVINYLLTKRFNTKHLFVMNGLIICSCIIISARLHFLNWADTVGSREHPDPETLEVVAFERIAGLIVAIIGITIVSIRLYQKKIHSLKKKGIATHKT